MTRPGWPELPAVLAEIADVAGLDAALAIAEMKGGQRVTIPARLRPDHWLVAAVGAETAEVLSRHFCSDRLRVEIAIPLGPTGSYIADRRRRAIAVARALAEGASANEAAARAGITRRSVMRHKSTRGNRDDSSGEGGQGSLF